MTKISNKYCSACIYLALALSTFLVYWQVRNYDFINFDDPVYVTEGPHVQAGLTRESIRWALTTGYACFWHPLTWLSYMLDTQLFGTGPRGYHLTNILLHITNTLLLFVVLKQMTGSLWQSAFVAAVFALHPLHVESVAWIAERKDVLSTMFWILTMGAYLRFVKRPSTGRYLLTLLTFVLGLMAKSMLVTLPFVLLLLDYWPLGRFQNSQALTNGSQPNLKYASTRFQWRVFYRLVWEKVPFFIFSAIFSAISFALQQAEGIIRPAAQLPLLYRIENTLVSYIAYIGKMLWPSHLAIYYPHPLDTLPMWKIAGSALLLVSITTAVIWKGRRCPYLPVGWLWYLGTFLPVIGLVQIGLQALADRWTYVTLTGLFMIVAWGVPDLLARVHYRKIIPSLFSLVLLSALGVTAWYQVRHWRNNLALYEHAAEVVPNNWWACSNLGATLLELGKPDEAVTPFIEALQIDPHNPQVRSNLGLAFAHQGRSDEAIMHFTEALTLDPTLADTHHNLAIVLEEQGRLDKAIEHYTKAVQIQPNHVQAHQNLAIALAEQGRLDEAVEHYTNVLQLQPNSADIHRNLANVLAQQRKTDQAIIHFTEALRLRPNWPEVLNNLAWILAMQDQAEFRPKAIRLAERACELTGYNQPVALGTLAAAYTAAGQFSDAVATAERAADLALSLDREELANDIRSRLELYRAAKPYHQPL